MSLGFQDTSYADVPPASMERVRRVVPDSRESVRLDFETIEPVFVPSRFDHALNVLAHVLAIGAFVTGALWALFA